MKFGEIIMGTVHVPFLSISAFSVDNLLFICFHVHHPQQAADRWVSAGYSFPPVISTSSLYVTGRWGGSPRPPHPTPPHPPATKIRPDSGVPEAGNLCNSRIFEGILAKTAGGADFGGSEG